MRLIKDAQEALTKGELSMTAAVTLSRMPHSMQHEVLVDAIVMPSKEFVEKGRKLVKDYREAVRNGCLEMRAEIQPYLRTMTEIREEVSTYRAAGIHLKMDGAVTALDGWKSCIKWLLHLDPISLEEACHKQEQARAEQLSSIERRKANRRLKHQLLGESHE